MWRFGVTTLLREELLRILWFETWWRWIRPANDPLLPHDYACHYFNLLEAAIWFIFSALVIRRWRTGRRSPLELGYAAAFLLFGASDVVEAWILTSWLLWWKAANLIALIVLRREVIRRLYPGSRLY